MLLLNVGKIRIKIAKKIIKNYVGPINQEIVDEAVSGVFYFYAKNLDDTNFIILQTTASEQYARLSPGEFCFFPVNDGNGLEARADTNSCVLEYAIFTKG